MTARAWIAGKLTDIGWWLIDFAETVRGVAKAAAYARTHPTELPKHDGDA